MEKDKPKRSVPQAISLVGPTPADLELAAGKNSPWCRRVREVRRGCCLRGHPRLMGEAHYIPARVPSGYGRLGHGRTPPFWLVPPRRPWLRLWHWHPRCRTLLHWWWPWLLRRVGCVLAETKAVTGLHPMPHAFVLVTKMRFHGMPVDLLCTTCASSWRPRALICMTVPFSVTCRY